LTTDFLEDPHYFVKCEPAVTSTGNRGHSERVPCTRDTALYLMSIMEYIIVCICFSIFDRDQEFRQPIYKNQFFFFSLIIIIVYNTYKLMFLDDWSRDFFELANISFKYRVFIIILVILNLLISIFFEYFATRIFTRWWIKEGDEPLE
jgi:magnesium-transporting ATPase (P-type)